MCCEERREEFRDSTRCEWFLAHLRGISDASFFGVAAYCVMPDHVHLLVEGLEAGSSFLDFIKRLKIKTSREFAATSGEVLWQKKYFDHILRSHESMNAVAWYIWMNP